VHWNRCSVAPENRFKGSGVLAGTLGDAMRTLILGSALLLVLLFAGCTAPPGGPATENPSFGLPGSSNNPGGPKPTIEVPPPRY